MFTFDKAKRIIQVMIKNGEDERRRWDRWHAWYAGDFAPDDSTPYGSTRADMGPGDPDSDIRLETNYPYAFIDTMIANICPTNPVVTINGRKSELKQAAKAREELVNDTLKRDKTHAKSWNMCIFTAICGRAFSKTTWDKVKGRPKTTVINPRNVFYDMTREWDEIRWLFEAVPMLKEEFEAKVRGPENPNGQYDPEAVLNPEFGEMPTWLRDRSLDSSDQSGETKGLFEWITVYEFYDFVAGKFFHILPEGKKPLYESGLPFAYMRNPFEPMVFNQLLLDNTGVSDIKLIEQPQERMNEIDSLELFHSHTSISRAVINDNLVDNPEETEVAFTNASTPGSVIHLKGNSQATIDQMIGWTQVPQWSPQWDKMRDRTSSLIEFILGIPAYSRGVYGGAEVATEIALVDTATRTRNGRRIRVVEDWVVGIARKGLALWKEFLPADDVISVVKRGTFDTVELERGELAFPPRDPSGKPMPEQFDDEMSYDFDAIPYSPTENHRLVQLQKLQQFLPMMLNNPNIDQNALMTKLVELLGMDEIRQDPKMAAPQPGPPGQPGQPGQPGPDGKLPGGTPADVIQTGGMPAGLDMEAMMPPAGNQLASQPKV